LEVRHVFGASSSGAGAGTDGGNPVPGLTSLDVHSASEVTALIEQARARRCTKATRSNADSSRSHVVFTLKIEAESSRGIIRHGCLHMIDLAGSERLGKSGSAEHPELLREAQNINKSLSVLANVMTALHKKEKHVPFRESALTSLLRHSLGGDCKALMVCNVSPSAAHVQESMCSLRFAQKVNAVVTHKNRK
jgi:kinesin family protein C1